MIKIYKLITVILFFIAASATLKAQSTVTFTDSSGLSSWPSNPPNPTTVSVPSFDTSLGTLTNVSLELKYANRFFPTSSLLGRIWSTYSGNIPANGGPCWAFPNNSIKLDTLYFAYNGQNIIGTSTPVYAQNLNKDTGYIAPFAVGGYAPSGGFLPLISDSFVKNDYPLLPFMGDGVTKVTAADYKDSVTMISAGTWNCSNGAQTQSSISPFGVRADFTVTYNYTPNAPLPVKNLTFTVSKRDHSEVQLDWTALNETNLSEYIIERSSNGIVFDKIGNIKAKGETLQQKKNSYSFIDRDLPCGSILYRLRLVDQDESISYSKVRSIKNQCLFKQVTVSPNPFADKLTISFPTEVTAKDNFDVELIDLFGRTIYKKSHSHKTIMLNDSKLNLPTSIYPSGIYFLRISNAIDINRTFKVVKK